MLYRIYDRQESTVIDSKDYLLGDDGTLFSLATGEVDMCRYRVDLFTGLIDSEGVPVFENDVVSFEVQSSYEEVEKFDGMQVNYDSEYCCFTFGLHEFAMVDGIIHQTILVTGVVNDVE